MIFPVVVNFFDGFGGCNFGNVAGGAKRAPIVEAFLLLVSSSKGRDGILVVEMKLGRPDSRKGVTTSTAALSSFDLGFPLTLIGCWKLENSCLGPGALANTVNTGLPFCNTSPSSTSVFMVTSGVVASPSAGLSTPLFAISLTASLLFSARTISPSTFWKASTVFERRVSCDDSGSGLPYGLGYTFISLALMGASRALVTKSTSLTNASKFV